MARATLPPSMNFPTSRGSGELGSKATGAPLASKSAVIRSTTSDFAYETFTTVEIRRLRARRADGETGQTPSFGYHERDASAHQPESEATARVRPMTCFDKL